MNPFTLSFLDTCDLCHDDFPLAELELCAGGQWLCEKCRETTQMKPTP